MRRRLNELTETQRWVHHVADLDKREELTIPPPSLRAPWTSPSSPSAGEPRRFSCRSKPEFERLTFSAISFGVDHGPLAARVHMTRCGFSTYPCICLEPHLSDDLLTGNHDQDSQQTGGAEAQGSRHCGDPIAAWATASCRKKPAL